MTDTSNRPIYKRAISYMNQQGWRSLTAKSRGFEQSLFDHTRIEIDTLLQLAPIFSQTSHFGLTDEELEILIVSLMAHDVGKQLDEWQDYIGGRSDPLSDINRQLTSDTVPTLYPALGLEPRDGVGQVIENCINLHMRHERRTGNVLEAILGARGTQDRWFFLAEIVFHVDNLCSIGSASGALGYLRDRSKPFSLHLHTAYHQVSMRGVSTPILHRAAEELFEEKGWTPLLYFREATIYVKSSTESEEQPTQENVRERLAQVLQENLQGEVARLMVGSPTAAILPKPELFGHEELDDYLRIAYGRIGGGSFSKKKSDIRRKVIADYLSVKQSEVDSETLERESDRISQAQPEMIVFKFFKAAMGRALVGDYGFQKAAELYVEVFGDSTWDGLQKTATLMPAKEMTLVIDPFWRLSSEKFGKSSGMVEELDSASRLEILLEILNRIAREVYSQLKNPPSRAALAEDMARSFIMDLVAPSSLQNLSEIAELQRESYSISKKYAGKKNRNARYFCPVCNNPFESGTQARADFVDKPESHTNRATAYGGFDKIFICNACKYERLLRQVLLGARTQEVMVLMPRMNIGRAAGAELVRRARRIYHELYTVMVGETDDPDVRVSMSLTGMIAGKSLDKDVLALSDKEVSSLFSYRASEKKRRESRKQLEKSLKEEFGNLKELNDEWMTEFGDWASALDAVIANEISEEPAPDIRREAYNLGIKMRLICHTPNLILIPFSYPLAVGNDNETNQALRKLFVELIVGLSLDCAVAILRDSESFTLPEPQGVAWIPSVAPARRLVGDMLERFERRRKAQNVDRQKKQLDTLVNSEWVPLGYGSDVYKAIGAASVLAGDTNYSDRSHIYQILSAPTVGHVMRRIEQQSSTGQVPYYHFKTLKTLEEVLS